MRHSATRALLERDDVIIVASVSCIYGIGAAETYSAMTQDLVAGEAYDQQAILRELVTQQYRRNDAGFARGCFRVRGDSLEIWPAHLEDRAWKLSFFGDDLERIDEFDPLTGHKTDRLDRVRVYANSHYVTPRPTLNQAIKGIQEELQVRLDQLIKEGRLLEAQRLEQRTNFDLEMIQATGACNGIENYSRYLTGRKPGEPPPTLFEYIPDNAICFADESHVTVPQLGGMYRGDYRRKFTLAEHGFRLPSCMDNRPLKFEEWDAMRPQSVFVSATPGPWEMERTGGVFTEQVIRPTGLIDPPVEIRPVASQVDDLIDECRRVAAAGLSRAGHDADQTHGRGPDRVHARAGHPRALHALRHRHARAHRDPARPPPRRLRRAGRHQPACARGSTSPNARWSRSWTPTRRVFCAPRPRSSRPSAAPRATSTAGSSCTPTASPARWSAPCSRPSAAAKSRRPITSPTASPRRRSARTSTTSWRASTRATPTWPASRPGSTRASKGKLGCNLQTVLDGLRKDMLKAAENLEFEEAARLRDELKRLEAVDLAVHDDPLARQSRHRGGGGGEGRARARSTTGKPGSRAYKGKGRRRQRALIRKRTVRAERGNRHGRSNCGPADN